MSTETIEAKRQGRGADNGRAPGSPSDLGGTSKIDGSLGGVVVFLVWLWITDLAILSAPNFNSEHQRTQQRDAGERAPARRAVPRAARHQQAGKEKVVK